VRWFLPEGILLFRLLCHERGVGFVSSSGAGSLPCLRRAGALPLLEVCEAVRQGLLALGRRVRVGVDSRAGRVHERCCAERAGAGMMFAVGNDWPFRSGEWIPSELAPPPRTAS